MEKFGETTKDFFDNSYYKLNKKYLIMIGQWPYQKKSKRVFISSAMSLSIASVVVFEVIYFLEVLKDINKMIDCLMALVITYGAYVMLGNSVATIDTTKQILDGIRRNWMTLRNDDEVRIFQKYADKGKILVVVYSILVLMSLNTFMATPLIPKLLDLAFPLNESRPIKNLLEVQYYVDPDKYYVPIYVHGVQAAVFVVFIILTIDTYFFMIVEHACGMFAVLGNRFARVSFKNTKALNGRSDADRDTIISDEIIECVKYQRCCIRFAEMIENSFTLSFIMVLFFNMFIISVTGVQTIVRKNEPEKMFSYALNTVSIVFRLFFVSWSGQKLHDHSEQLLEYLSDLTWYEFPSKSKKLIFFILLRSSRPCDITAGKMMPMNFQTYCALIQTSMSYFTMILSTQ